MNGSHVVNQYVQSLLNQLTVTITISLVVSSYKTGTTKNIITLYGLHVSVLGLRLGLGLGLVYINVVIFIFRDSYMGNWPLVCNTWKAYTMGFVGALLPTTNYLLSNELLNACSSPVAKVSHIPSATPQPMDARKTTT